jgi:hypothetical protein
VIRLRNHKVAYGIIVLGGEKDEKDQ